MSNAVAQYATQEPEHFNAYARSKSLIELSVGGDETIFGHPKRTYLPLPTSIPLGHEHTVLQTPSTTTMALLNSIIQADRHSYTHATNHAAHVYNVAPIIGLTPQETNDAYIAALLHDISKLHFMELIKVNRRLTPQEKERVDQHPALSYLMLSASDYSDTVRYCALFHHYNIARQWGYPQIDEQLQKCIVEMATEYALPIPKEPCTGFSNISERQWLIINLVTLLDSFDAAIDPNRGYKIPLKLSEVLNDFETSWNTLFNPDLRSSFEDYVSWLEHIHDGQSSVALIGKFDNTRYQFE